MLTTFSAPHLAIPLHSNAANPVLRISDASTNARMQRLTVIIVVDRETFHHFNLIPGLSCVIGFEITDNA